MLCDPFLHRHVDLVFGTVATAVGNLFLQLGRHHGHVDGAHVLQVELGQVVPLGLERLAQPRPVQGGDYGVGNVRTISIRNALRPVCSAAISVLPLPPNRSSTFSPARDEYCIARTAKLDRLLRQVDHLAAD